MPRTCRAIRWGALLLAMVAALLGLCRGLEVHPDATNRLRDDAFYEFTWAANVAAGRGPIVSDGVTTSGVQLLWSLCLVPVAWVFGPAALPFVAPWLGFGLHALTALLWWLRTRDGLTGACIALCWLGNPLLVRECQNGQETALACLLLASVWWSRSGPLRWFVGLGVLTVLARSDLLTVVAAVSLWRFGMSWWAFVAPGLAFAVHTAGNLLLGGGWLPDSALPMAWLWHANHAARGLGTDAWLAEAWWFARPVLLGGPWAQASAMGLGFAVFVILRAWWPASLRAVPALAVGCASTLGVADLATPGWVALFLALLPASGRRPLPKGLLLLVLGGAAIVMLHWAIRWYPRDYYVAPLVVIAMAAIQRFGRWRLLLLLAALAQLQDHRRIGPEPLMGQLEMEMAGQFVGRLLPAHERIGCFNSGIVTFRADVLAAPAERRGVVNLDGVVDARSFAALRQGRLMDWLEAQHLRFLLDNPAQFMADPLVPHASGRWFGDEFHWAEDLVEIARFDVPAVDAGRHGADSLRLYWRRGAGAEPTRPTIVQDLGVSPGGGRYVLWPAVAGAVLQGEERDGTRVDVVAADATTTMVVCVPATALGTGRLFVVGDDEPVLRLPKL